MTPIVVITGPDGTDTYGPFANMAEAQAWGQARVRRDGVHDLARCRNALLAGVKPCPQPPTRSACYGTVESLDGISLKDPREI